jgi:adenosylcobinamide-GDP ribazoletransferase
MKGFLSAIGFLTILPGGKSGGFDPRAMIPWFPVVGLLLGAILALFDHLALALWPAAVTAVLDVALLAILTGALHLDGLGDTADGVFSHRPRETALAIMKDSRVGAMGMIAVILGIGLKWGGLASLGEHRSMVIFLVPAFARAAMMFGIRTLPYGRPEGGTGHDFFGAPLKWPSFWALMLVTALSLLTGTTGLRLVLGFGAVTGALLLFYKRQMGCVTGDMLGAMTEVTEAALFLLAAAGANT